MRAMVTKGGLYTWINVRENKFLEEKFAGVELLEQTISVRENSILHKH